MTMTEQLEQMVRETSLLHVLIGLELVCAEQAAIMRLGIGGGLEARRWDAASAACGKVARNEAQSVS